MILALSFLLVCLFTEFFRFLRHVYTLQDTRVVSSVGMIS